MTLHGVQFDEVKIAEFWRRRALRAKPVRFNPARDYANQRH